MLVTLPVCARDVHLARFNLELLTLLEPSLPLPLDCLVTTDDGFNPVEIYDQAKKVFRSVKVYRYGKSWNGAPPPWPWPQNWAWQQSAKQIERTLGQQANRKKGQAIHWFWWEADVVPCRSGAFTELAEASNRTKAPFAGHIEGHSIPQYLAGPALYPMAISRHVQSALMVRKSPFDIVASQEDGIVSSGKVEDLNGLIYHRWREDNQGDTFSSLEDFKRLVPEGAAFFHRCDDGSLQWLLSEGKTGIKPSPHNARSSNRKQTLEETQNLCRTLLTVPYSPTPPLVNQLQWPGGLFNLPLSAGDIYFNSAIVRRGNNVHLLTRHTHNNRNSIVSWELDLESMRPGSPETLSAQHSTEHYEDPRALWWEERNRYVLIVCNYDLTRHHFAHQTILECNESFVPLETHHVIHGKNGSALHTNTGHEKNWTPFIHEGKLLVVYSINPHVVLQLEEGRKATVHQTGNGRVSWPWGEMRGSTPPILVGDEYVTFFHSSIPWRVVGGAAKRRYLCGALAFSAKPPFRVTRITKAPLLVGSEQDPLLQWSPLVCFPVGSIIDGDDYLITGGCNDACCFWQRIPIEVIDQQLEAV